MGLAATAVLAWRSPFAASEDRNVAYFLQIEPGPAGGARRSRGARIATRWTSPASPTWSWWRSPFAASEDRNSPDEPIGPYDGLWRSPFAASEDRNPTWLDSDDLVQERRSPFAASEDRNLPGDRDACRMSLPGGARRSRRARIATLGFPLPTARVRRWRSPFAASEDRNYRAVRPLLGEGLRPDEARAFIETAFRDGAIQTAGTSITRVVPRTSRFSRGGTHGEKKQIVLARLGKFFGLSAGGT